MVSEDDIKILRTDYASGEVELRAQYPHGVPFTWTDGYGRDMSALTVPSDWTFTERRFERRVRRMAKKLRSRAHRANERRTVINTTEMEL